MKNKNNLENHLKELITAKLKSQESTEPVDYFSWGRDKRHRTEKSNEFKIIQTKENPVRSLLKNLITIFIRKDSISYLLFQFRRRFHSFNETYNLMSDDYSKTLFAELILLKLTSEKKLRLSSFSDEFVNSYEVASEMILKSEEKRSIYGWDLKKIQLDNPSITFFTVPEILNLHLTDKLYRYQNKNTIIEVSGGDIVLDAGIGWGDTTIYLAAKVNTKPGGHLFAFDILEEGIDSLLSQQNLNPSLNNITPVLSALSNTDNEYVFISNPGPGSKVVSETTAKKVPTLTIDSFVSQNRIAKINFIKMDIEGAEVPALYGARQTIANQKPKLAISVYHKWDDLLIIPKLIHSIREDYQFFLDCSTGFGGEAILFCR